MERRQVGSKYLRRASKVLIGLPEAMVKAYSLER